MRTAGEAGIAVWRPAANHGRALQWNPVPDEFRTGDIVRVLRVPADVAAASEEETRTAFRLAVGKTYEVQAVNEIGWLELNLGAEADRALGMIGNAIWIEPDCIEPAAQSGELEPGQG